MWKKILIVSKLQNEVDMLYIFTSLWFNTAPHVLMTTAYPATTRYTTGVFTCNILNANIVCI